jgi:hypothetical protein
MLSHLEHLNTVQEIFNLKNQSITIRMLNKYRLNIRIISVILNSNHMTTQVKQQVLIYNLKLIFNKLNKTKHLIIPVKQHLIQLIIINSSQYLPLYLKLKERMVNQPEHMNIHEKVIKLRNQFMIIKV